MKKQKFAKKVEWEGDNTSFIVVILIAVASAWGSFQSKELALSVALSACAIAFLFCLDIIFTNRKVYWVKSK